ncbi:hypothetical protein [Pasteurella testudinis]|uniref:hypothetical protein n=1 Tax=Pasteurella testudinis TaxID=761 RepID=UPI004057DD91
MERLKARLQRTAAQIKLFMTAMWQTRMAKLQQSGVAHKLIGGVALLLSAFFLVGIGFFSLFLFGFLFFISALQLLFLRQPHFATAATVERADEVIIDTTAVKTAVKRD